MAVLTAVPLVALAVVPAASEPAPAPAPSSAPEGTAQWKEAAGEFKDTPGYLYSGGGTPRLFLRGARNHMWTRPIDELRPGAAENLGGSIASHPDCVTTRHGTGRRFTDCVARGTDNQVWHIRSTDGDWGRWTALGGDVTSAPAVAVLEDGMMVVARGRNGELWALHADYAAGSPDGWKSVGGRVASDPDCAPGPARRIDCVARGEDDQLWMIDWSDGKWGTWRPLGGAAKSAPAIVRIGDGTLAIFARGRDDALWSAVDEGGDGNGTVWRAFGGTLTSKPSCVSQDGGVECVVAGQGGRLWRMIWSRQVANRGENASLP